MSPSFMEKMFDPFEREKNSTLSGVQGTGLSAGEQGTFGNNEQTINSIRETADHAC